MICDGDANYVQESTSGYLFTKRQDVLPQEIMKSRCREIRVYNCPIALKYDRHLGSSVAEMPFKF